MVSLDGSITGFHADMETYYGIVNSYHPEMYLVGSVTAREGISLFTDTFPAETAKAEILDGGTVLLLYDVIG